MPTIKIAVLADAAQAKRELGTVATTAGKLSGSFAKFRAPAVAALGAIGVGAVGAVRAASDLNETVSKSTQIFGTNAGQIDTWASGAAKNLGLSKQAALESATGFGDMFSQIGFAGDQAAKMSTDVVGLSADLGSFNNLPTADVSDRIAAAFRGEYDSLQAVIPNINAARVESEAMAATGKKTAKSLTAQEKATAVLAIVSKDGAKATGDFARTSDQAANSQKIAAATAADLGAQLGQKVLPAYTQVLQVGLQFLGFLTQHTTAVTAVVVVLGGLAAAVLAVSAAESLISTGKSIAAFAQWSAGAGKAAASSVVAAAKTVASWVASAATSAAAWVVQSAKIVATWVATAARAVASAVASAATWVANAAVAAAGWVAQGAVMVASWVATAAAAVVQAAATAAAWVASNAAAAASWVASTAAMVAQQAVLLVARGAVVAYTAVQWLLNAAMAANPIGLVVLAIVALVAIFVIAYKNSETFRNIVTGALNAVLAAAKFVWTGIKVAAQAVWSFISGYVKLQILIVTTVIKAIVAVAKAVWGAIKAAAQAVWGFISGYIKTQIAIVTAVIKTVVGVAKAVWNAIKTAASAVWNALKTGFTGAVNAVKDKFNSLKSAASSIIAKIKSIFSPGALLAAGKQLIQGLIDGIRDKIGAAVDAVRAGVQKIKNLLPGSPIRTGPLKSWNNGGAGKRLMGLLASGISAGAPRVQSTLSRALEPMTSLSGPALSISGSGGAAGSAGGNVYQLTVNVPVGGDPVGTGKAIVAAIAAYERAGGRKRAG